MEDDTESNYLVYNPIQYAGVKDNWLLDVELMSEEFHADFLSIQMQELDIPTTSEMRKAMHHYPKFFDSKERVSKFLTWGSTYNAASQLHMDILAVLSGAKTNTASGIICSVLLDGLNLSENHAIANIRKFGSEEYLWKLINRYTGYEYVEGSNLDILAAHILFTALSVSMKSEHLKGLDKLISRPHGQRCYDMIDEWMHSELDDALYDIAREIEEKYELVSRFDQLEVVDLLESECFPCINECILRHFMYEIADNVIKTEDIVAAVEKRRTLKWYKRVRYYFDGLLQVANMQQFYQQNIRGFHIAEYEKLWKEYCGNYCKMDYFYRMFHTAFGKSLKESSTVLEDLYKEVAGYVEKLYKNWYLQELGAQWSKLTCDEFAKDARLNGIPSQSSFYRSYVTDCPQREPKTGANY